MNIDFIGLLASGEPGFYVGGDNALFWGPMAWTVIFGLTFATFLTLVVVPSMYVFFENVRNKIAGNKA
jgi:multidrug efflux pump subunit AcrB